MIPPADLHGIFTQGRSLALGEALLQAAHARLSFLTGVAATTVEQLATAALPLAPGDQPPLMAQLSRISRGDTLEIGGLPLCLPPEVIRRNLALTQCEATLVNGIAALTDGFAPFHLARNFWASSTEAVEGAGAITLATVDVNRLIREFRPTILTMDIEFHPEQTPAGAISATLQHLLAQGFVLDLSAGSARGLVFDRADTPAPNTTLTGE